MAGVEALPGSVVGAAHVLAAGEVPAGYGHDEALGVAPGEPAFVVRPGSTAVVVAVLRAASAAGLAVTARGSGTGLSGGAITRPGGLVLSFERMNQVLEIDTANHVAVVQPGVTLAELDAAAAAEGLVYPVFPGEMSASLGGTVATNAGGMRAVKYGVTRHHVLGLEAVLASGEVIRTVGRSGQPSSDHGHEPGQAAAGLGTAFHCARGRCRTPCSRPDTPSATTPRRTIHVAPQQALSCRRQRGMALAREAERVRACSPPSAFGERPVAAPVVSLAVRSLVSGRRHRCPALKARLGRIGARRPGVLTVPGTGAHRLTS